MMVVWSVEQMVEKKVSHLAEMKAQKMAVQ